MALNVLNTQLTAVTTGTGANLDTKGFVYLTCYAVWSAGVTAGVVTLEGSPDGTNFAPIGTTAFVASTTTDINAAQAHRYIRARISTTVVGGTVTVFIAMTGPIPNDGGWGAS